MSKRSNFKPEKTAAGRKKQQAAIRASHAKQGSKKIKSKSPPGRVKDKNGKWQVPWGRTFSTYDHFLGNSKTGSKKKRPIVVIETNDKGHLAVVPLSSRTGQNRTHLPNYQQGQSYFKHFVEIEDNEGNPIVPNKKFRENALAQDVSREDVLEIRDKVFFHSKPSLKNVKNIVTFRKK